MKVRYLSLFLLVGALVTTSCKDKAGPKPDSASEVKKQPPKGEEKPLGSFKLAWSEYPSWSVFDVASSKGFINGKKGKLGPIEKKWNVDIVLKEADYDGCLAMYGSGEVDAVAITNMDILSPSLSRKSIAILPTSTSYGADALLVTNEIKNVDGLKAIEVRGLEKSVSEYMFARNLELKGEKPTDYKFTSMDPGAAAVAMQQGQRSMKAIAVWNPYVLQTLSRQAGKVRVLFDSTSIPGEIIDMVAMADASLNKPGGKAFAHAIIDAFYAVNRDLADSGKRQDTLKAIGEKFANLSAEQMETVVNHTRFYASAEDGISLFTGGPVLKGVSETRLSEVMPRVQRFCRDYEIIKADVNIAYGSAGDGQLRFDPSYMKTVAATLKNNVQ